MPETFVGEGGRSWPPKKEQEPAANEKCSACGGVVTCNGTTGERSCSQCGQSAASMCFF